MESISQELRQAILQCAIQGKLTKQLPEDGNAADLLEQIREKQQHLVSEKRIKKGKPLPEISEDMIPFDIPANWKWCYLQDVVNIRSAVRVHQSDWQKTGVPFYRAREIVKIAKHGFVDNELFIDENLYQKYAETSGVPHEGDIMVSGVGTLGANFVVKKDDRFYYKDASVLCFENFAKIYPEFIKLLLDTPYLHSQIYAQEAFGTTVATLTMERAYCFIIPFPPLNEQHRIVARVEELMAKIDELEKIENELRALHKAFPGDMKAALLQAAMQGKLTEQLPEDGTAAELMAEINAEKERLIREKKLKKEKPLDPISAEEIPFELPENWEWCRLGEVGYFTRGNGIKRDETTEFGKPCIRYGQMYTTYRTRIDKAVSCVPQSIFDKAVKVNYGDIVMALTGENNVDIALAAVYLGEEPIAMGGDMTKFSHIIDPLYIVYVINSAFSIKQKSELAKGNIIVHISNDKLATLLFPLPPLAEQHRIVEMLDKLLPLCESLQETL